MGERCRERQPQAEIIECIRGQHWGLGSPEEPCCGGGGGGGQRRLLRGSASFLCSPYSTSVFAEGTGELGGGQERNRSYQCVPYNLTSSFPSKVTSRLLVILIHIFTHFLYEFYIILYVFKLYVDSILHASSYTLFSYYACKI